MVHAIFRSLRWFPLVLLALLAGPATAEASHCGGLNQPACTIFDFPSHAVGCQTGLTEIPFPGGTCIQLDADGFPPFCGGANERPCRLNEHIPSCKAGLVEHFPTDRCIQLDSDGFPSFCGGAGERPCTIIEHIPSCKTGLVEDFVANRCTARDASGFPEFCGDALERACTVIEHIPSCKPGLQERATIVNGSLVSICHGPPPTCGRNGQRACTVLEHIPSCQPGLSERPFDFGVCGADPVNWDSTEVARGGPRTVFFIHGRGGDLGGGAEPNELLTRLNADAPNVRQIYGVDWNNAGSDPRRLTTYKYFDPACAATEACGHLWGAEEFDATTFRIIDVAYGLAQAIKGLPTEGDITIIGYSFGGIMARQLVFRHYDELRAAGKRIAEVVTIGAPNRGGIAGALEITDGASLQMNFACAPKGIGPSDGLSLPELQRFDRGGCELGQWIDWMQNRQEGNFPFPGPWSIDDGSYPHIRWVAIASNNRRLAVSQILPSVEFFGSLFGDYADLLRDLANPDIVPFHDSDGTITVSSALGILADECYPFRRERILSDGIELLDVRRFYSKKDGAGVTQLQEAFSRVCFNPGARRDPRIVEGSNDDGNGNAFFDDGFPHDLTGVDHSVLTEDEKVGSFVVAALHVYGDIDGDGIADLAADAGLDVIAECAGGLTTVALDASASIVSANPSVSYTWSGSFGTVTGVMAQVALPSGAHVITLTVADGDLESVDQVLVTVADTTPPTLGGVIGYTVEATAADGTPFTFDPQAADVCSAVTVQRVPDLSTYPLGSTVVEITATDASGNSTTGTVAVTVEDTTPPVITAPADLSAEANGILSTIAIGTATATDVFPVTVASDAAAVFPLGDTEVTWTATDANGNSSQATQRVTVVDTTPPVLVVPPDVTVIAAGALTAADIGAASATDIFGATVTHDAPASFPIGTTEVTWTAVDGNGNRASATQRIHAVYEFEGFQGPIQPGGVYKASRTLPLQFRLSFAGDTPAVDAEAMLSVDLVGPDGATVTPLDVSANGPADGGRRFRFVGDHYQFNLSTAGWVTGSYRLSVHLDDGRTHIMTLVLR